MTAIQTRPKHLVFPIIYATQMAEFAGQKTQNLGAFGGAACGNEWLHTHCIFVRLQPVHGNMDGSAGVSAGTTPTKRTL
ncbi:MAG: hypothetical protein ABI986_14170 [Chloroflexota bacterium]